MDQVLGQHDLHGLGHDAIRPGEGMDLQGFRGRDKKIHPVDRALMEEAVGQHHGLPERRMVELPQEDEIDGAVLIDRIAPDGRLPVATALPPRIQVDGLTRGQVALDHLYYLKGGTSAQGIALGFQAGRTGLHDHDGIGRQGHVAQVGKRNDGGRH